MKVSTNRKDVMVKIKYIETPVTTIKVKIFKTNEISIEDYLWTNC